MYQFDRKEYEKRMEWYQDARFGMFIHWGLYSIPARGEWVRSTEEMPEEEYLPFMKEFDARDYNPKQWAKEAKAAPEIDTVFLTTSIDYAYLSSSIVKEYASFGVDVEQFVPAGVVDRIKEKYSR